MAQLPPRHVASFPGAGTLQYSNQQARPVKAVLLEPQQAHVGSLAQGSSGESPLRWTVVRKPDRLVSRGKLENVHSARRRMPGEVIRKQRCERPECGDSRPQCKEGRANRRITRGAMYGKEAAHGRKSRLTR
jgi:hypothetical protein